MLKSTRIRDLFALAVLAAVVAWLLVRTLYGSLPPIPRLRGCVAVPGGTARSRARFMIRSRVGKREIGDGPRQLHPITVARAVALAKASALVGSAALGVWAGFLLYLLPQRSFVQAASEDTSGVVVGAIGAFLLVAAALWLEHCCKTPPEDPGEPAA